MIGTVFDIKELAVHDGPGLRTTVFLKGCPLRCVWCHNPEGLSQKPQLYVRKHACRNCGLCRKPCNHPDCQIFGRCLHICPQGLISISGKQMDADTLAKKLRRNADMYAGGGGVTFSGGEPLLQAEFMLAVMDRLEGISCAIETSGYAAEETFRKVIGRMDFVYMDLKLADDALHRKYTGVSNERILKNLEILRQSGVPCVIRTPLIPGITDTKENLETIREILKELPHELLPYNKMAGAKYPLLDMEYPYDTMQ